MRTGRLRRVISIQQPTTYADRHRRDEDHQLVAIAGGANVWADIDESPGKESLQAAQVNAKRPVMVTMRYLAGITAQMRVLYGSRTFQIIGPLNLDQRNRTLVLYCEEHAP
jgi:SPP1 family predicted phage head-tail adaptor